MQNGMRAERKRERERGRGTGEAPEGCRWRDQPTRSPRKRSRESGARQPVGGAGQASLVRVKLKTGSRGKYKAEPAARGCGTVRQCNPEGIFTAGNLHTGKKLSWLLRGGNCMLLAPDLLSAVLGWDCHTHRFYGRGRGASREHCTDAEKVTKPRCAAKNAATWKNV